MAHIQIPLRPAAKGGSLRHAESDLRSRGERGWVRWAHADARTGCSRRYTAPYRTITPWAWDWFD